jgi:predicted metal-dependent hydrolase
MHDPRYLAGVVLFNRGAFFEAHDVWELLWHETHGTDRPFYQGLIQTAVGLCHFCNGNVRGAIKLYHSCRGYLERFAPHHLDMDVAGLFRQLEACFAELLSVENPDRSIAVNEELLPTIVLEPAPAEWPDPSPYLEVEDAEEA